jgi:hypothetical protein
MTDPSGYAKTLALPAGFDAPRLLRYDDVTAHAITRDDLGADVRGINASLDLIREVADGSGHRGGGTTSTWSGTSASSRTASHSRSASRPSRRLYRRLPMPPPEWRAAVEARFTRPYGPRFVRRARVRPLEARLGASTAPRPWTGSGSAARRPDDPRQARLHARQGASRSTRGLENPTANDTARRRAATRIVKTWVGRLAPTFCPFFG